jgi:hypothetical protein
MASQPFKLDLNPQLEGAQTLASRFYTDPAILAREKTHIFQRTWQLVVTLSQPCGERNGVPRTIADPETYFTFDLVGEPMSSCATRRACCARSATSAGIAQDRSPKGRAVAMC